MVVFMTGVVPGTCRIPKQVGGDREKAEKRRALSFKDNLGDLATTVGKLSVDNLSPAQLQHAGRTLGLYSSIWEKVFGGAPSGLVKRRLRKWEEYIDADDRAIERGGGPKGIEGEELRVACEERGLNILGKREEVLQKNLEGWLREKRNGGVTRLLFLQPEKRT